MAGAVYDSADCDDDHEQRVGFCRATKRRILQQVLHPGAVAPGIVGFVLVCLLHAFQQSSAHVGDLGVSMNASYWRRCQAVISALLLQGLTGAVHLQ